MNDMKQILEVYSWYHFLSAHRTAWLLYNYVVSCLKNMKLHNNQEKIVSEEKTGLWFKFLFEFCKHQAFELKKSL